MRKILKELGIRKSDEMEKNITLISQRNALVFLVLSLFIWSFVEYYQASTQQIEYHSLPSILLSTTVLVFSFSHLYLKRKYTKGDDEYKILNKNTLLVIGLFLLILFVFVIVSQKYIFSLMVG